MQQRSALTAHERRELKEIWLALWHERGEGFNRAESAPEVADLWYEAVLTFLARRDNRLNNSDDSANKTND